MKRLTSLICLILVMCLVFCACGPKAPVQTDTPKPSETTPGAVIETTEPIPLINLEDGMPVVNEPISVTIAVVPQGGAVEFDAKTNWMCQYFEKYSGLDITWEVIPSATAAERIPVMLNSGKMPDAIIGQKFNTAQLVDYGQKNELFLPVNDLLQYMPALSEYLEEHPSYLSKMKASDGNIYGFPMFTNVHNYVQRFEINKEWLANVGLDMPNTLADLKEVLMAFRDQDADGDGDATNEIPWTGAWNSEQGELAMILNAFGIVNPNNKSLPIAMDYSSGNPEITLVTDNENFKAALLYLRDLWNEGLIDPGMFTQDISQAQATVMEGRAGFTEMSTVKVYAPGNESAWEVIGPLVDKEGDTPVFPGPEGIFSYALACMVINSDCDPDKAAALANLCDFFYTPEGFAFAAYGPEAGTEEDWNNDGYVFDAEKNALAWNNITATDAWTHRITFGGLYCSPGFHYAGHDAMRMKIAEKYPDSAIGQWLKDGIVYDQDQVFQIEKNSPYYVDPVPSFFFSADENARITEISTVLEPYIAEMVAKFITGEASIENDWDAFVKTANDYGAQEMFDLYKSYYELYLANS